MTNKMNRAQFREALLSVVRADYGFELYNWHKSVDFRMVRLSFYHLSNVYNAFCIKVNDNEPCIEWQYANENKKIAAKMKRISGYVMDILVNHGEGSYEWDKMQEDLTYYSELANMVYKAKYSTDVNVHTWNG